MSLQVWLPFTSDLSNQGLTNISITNNGATLDDNGKLGKCYSFDGSSNYLISNDYADLGNAFSLSCWFLMNSISGNQGLFCDRTASYSGFTIYFNKGKLVIDPCAASYSSSTRWTTNFTATTDTWYHLTITRTLTTIYVYINGELQTSKDVAFASSYGNCFTIGSFNVNGSSIATFLDGKINDLRIFDHVLSQKEIKEISKGLVAHYKLTGALDGINPNMLKDIPRDYNSAAYNAYKLDFTENLVAGETYTVQLWDVDVSHAAKTAEQLGVSLYWGGGSVKLVSWLGTSYFTDGHADYLATTFTVTSAQAGGTGATNPWFQVYNSPPNVNSTRYMSIGRWKLEKGSVATPYVKTTEEMGTDTTVYDTSGLNNHGTALGTLAISRDTARYCASTIFNGSNNIIEANPLPIETKTISLWVKTSWVSASEYKLAVHDKQTGLAIGWSGNYLVTYVSTANDGGLGSRLATTSTNYTANQWNHIVVIKTSSTTRTIYVNGILATPSGKKYWTGDMLKLHIGARYKDGEFSANFDGQLSDFRAYATELSEAAVFELYHTGQSISNHHGLIAYEFNESNPYISSHTSFGKNGVVTTKSFLEAANAGSIEKSGTINMADFYEN